MGGRLGLCILAGLLTATSTAAEMVQMTILPVVGPNAGGSASWQAFARNVRQAVTTGKTPIGNPMLTPDAVAVTDTVRVGQIVVSSFPSWFGVTNLPQAFAGEHGSRVHFVLHLRTSGVRFRLRDLSASVVSTDPNQCLSYDADLSNQLYDRHRIGIDHGPDRTPGTDDDRVYDNRQPGDLEVDELIYAGVGIAAECGRDRPGKTPQDKLNQLMSQLMGTTDRFTLTATYTLHDPLGKVLGAASAQVTVLPQPKQVLLGPQPESPLPLFLGAGAAVLLVLGYWLLRTWRRRARFRALEARYGEMPTGGEKGDRGA